MRLALLLLAINAWSACGVKGPPRPPVGDSIKEMPDAKP